MENKKLRTIYEDEDLLVIDKPAGINADDIPKRIHRLDKDTSGVFLIAKNDKALEFFQKEFQEKMVEKKYIALVVGEIKNNEGVIETLLGRSPNDKRKQKVYFLNDPKAEGKRKAITKYKILQKFKDYTLMEVKIETGRKHQIRAHFAYLKNPIAGDKMYGFKNQSCPKELKRQFLHANQIKIKLPSGKRKIFKSKLPEELKKILKKLKKYDH